MMIKKIRAFSLIEMLIVIAIIAILAVLGIVWYQDAVIRTNRSRGISLMQEEAVRRQQRFILTGTYGSSANPISSAAEYVQLGNIFQLSITTASAPAGFVLSLTANNASSALSRRVREAGCFEISLSQTGLQQVVTKNGSSPVAVNDEATRACWK